MSTRVTHYVFENPVGNNVAEARFTVGTINLLGMGEHARLVARHRERFEEMADIKGKKLNEEQFAELDPGLRAISNAWMRWARVEVSLRRVQIKTHSDAEWIDSDLAELGWNDVEGLGTLPSDLLAELDRTSVQCNPGVFGLFVPDDDDGDSDPKARKVGVQKK